MKNKKYKTRRKMQSLVALTLTDHVFQDVEFSNSEKYVE